MSVGGHVFYDYYDGTGVYTDFYVNSTEEITVSSYLIIYTQYQLGKALADFYGVYDEGYSFTVLIR